MKHLIFVLALGLTGITLAQNDAATIQPLVVGEQLTIHSDILSQDRILNIYLPPGYHPDSTKRYPVIYVLDGSMWEDFMHITGIVQFESYPWINWVPESIVVGISNVDRKHDFTFPTSIEKDRQDFPTTGGSADFMRFLQEEMIPEVEARYKVNDMRTLIGQSLGGLLATEILFTQPDLFSHYLIVSPSLWWDAESLLKKMPEFGRKKTIHVAVGKEHKVMIKDAKALAKLLRSNEGVEPEVSFNFLKQTDHSNNMHEATYVGLRELYRNLERDK